MYILLFTALITMVGANGLLNSQTKPSELSSSIITLTKGKVKNKKITLHPMGISKGPEAGERLRKKANSSLKPNNWAVESEVRTLRDNESDPPWMK